MHVPIKITIYDNKDYLQKLICYYLINFVIILLFIGVFAMKYCSLLYSIYTIRLTIIVIIPFTVYTQWISIYEKFTKSTFFAPTRPKLRRIMIYNILSILSRSISLLLYKLFNRLCISD